MTAPTAGTTPRPDTHLVLVWDGLFESMARPGEKVTIEWGKPNQHGFYEPTMHTQTWQSIAEAAEAALAEAVALLAELMLPTAWQPITDHPGMSATILSDAHMERVRAFLKEHSG